MKHLLIALCFMVFGEGIVIWSICLCVKSSVYIATQAATEAGRYAEQATESASESNSILLEVLGRKSGISRTKRIQPRGNP